MDSLTPPPSAGRASAKEHAALLPLLRARTADPSPPSTPTDTPSTRSSVGTRSPSPTTPSTTGSPDAFTVFAGDLVLQPAFAAGAWSKVQRGTLVGAALPYGSKTTQCVYAVKTPAHSLARPVLQREARILTHIHAAEGACAHVVPFYGLQPATNAIVLGLGGSSLATEIAAHAASLRQGERRHRGPKVLLTDPIIGLGAWNRLAQQLIEGLLWLHGAGVIHGDIKPANILISSSLPDSDVMSTYCDFSSARLCVYPPAPLPSDAVTTAYASPELLASLVPPSQGVPTKASDAWALAVTLLVAATGEEPYAGAQSTLQRLAMARSGAALAMAQSGNEARRVRRGGPVSMCLEGALRRKESERTSLREGLAGLREHGRKENVAP